MSPPAPSDSPRRQLFSKRIDGLGLFLNLLSALAFYLATVFVHLGLPGSGVSPEFFASVRYCTGFVLFAAVLRLSRRKEIRGPMRFVLLRALFNVGAVVCFYRSVAGGETGQANVLNMTYPMFVAVLAPRLLGERVSMAVYALAALCGLGIIVHLIDRLPGFALMGAESWGLLSGFLAAFAIVSLRGAARVARIERILAYMFGLGFLTLIPFTFRDWLNAGAAVWPMALGSASFGIAGQYLLTISYVRIDATTGSIISSARIPIAVAAGFLFLAEPFSLPGWVGAALIFASNLLLALLGNRTQDASGVGNEVKSMAASPP